MTFRIMLIAVLALPGLAGVTHAREIPPVTLELTGKATPELLADFHQALRRMTSRQQDDSTAGSMAASSGRIDLQQFWKVEEGVAYTTGESSPRQRLNIIYPFEGEPPYRTIVHFHSGDWHSGDRASASDAAAYWAIYQGYALVSVGYRLAEEALWPAQLHDARAAVRFLRANAGRYQLDPDRVVVWGSGSGGHLAQMLAATNGEVSGENLAPGHEEASSEVQGVVSWNGIADITDLPPASRDAADQLLGYSSYQSKPGLEASPVAQVNTDFPPILLVHDTTDRGVPFEQSARMAIRVNAVTGRERARLNLLINPEHSGPGIASPGLMAESLDFVDDILYPDDENPHRSTFYPPIQTLGKPDSD
ncbi:MAG: alpha/beta hydrolase fold domain-containing protein [Marinobacter sp.]